LGSLSQECLLPLGRCLGDVFGAGSPGVAVALLPEPGPWRGAGGCLPGGEGVHRAGPAGKHGDGLLWLRLAEAAGVGEQVYPASGVLTAMLGAGGEGHEAVHGDIPEPGSGAAVSQSMNAP